MTDVVLQRPLEGYRFVQTRHGDTLQLVAARELGDATRWPDLIAFNSLRPPFLVDDPALRRPGVLVTGDLLRVPAAVAVVEAKTDAALVFERDVELQGGAVGVAGGDFAVASGLDNLRQALRHRVETEQGELIFHPDYGCLVRRLIGAVNGPTAALLAASYVRAALQRDHRIKAVLDSSAEVVGDVIRVSVTVEPIVGRRVDLSLDL